jgi:hypothetical protein
MELIQQDTRWQKQSTHSESVLIVYIKRLVTIEYFTIHLTSKLYKILNLFA